MPKNDLLRYLCGGRFRKLSEREMSLFEVVLITRIYRELTEDYLNKFKKYQMLMRNYSPKEGEMSGSRFIQEMVMDILSTEEYSVSGIANYTDIPEDVIVDLAAGINPHPTFEISRKIFELHASVRKDLYERILRKIIVENSCASYEEVA